MAQLKYCQGDEEDDFFWEHAGEQYVPSFHTRKTKETSWTVNDVLADAEKNGIKIEWLFSKKGGDHRQSAVVTLIEGDREAVALIYNGTVSVISSSEETSDYFARKLLENAPVMKLPEPDDSQIMVEFTYKGMMGVSRFHRMIDAPKWEEIRDNYPGDVRTELDRLVAMTPGKTTGKIAVLHGPPGTGKTTFLRSLTKAWQGKSDLIYVMDTEMFFNDPGYMMNVIGEGHGLAKVILCEDAEEFLREDAKKDVGQALSRLLNLGDGMLGQGLNMTLMFTTNVPKVALNEAITRDGRCFFNEELRKFSAQEAGEWLTKHGVYGRHVKPATLGELYALQRENA